MHVVRCIRIYNIYCTYVHVELFLYCSYFVQANNNIILRIIVYMYVCIITCYACVFQWYLPYACGIGYVMVQNKGNAN